MKDSGIEWIGEIPAEWEIERNKNMFSCSKSIVENEWSNTQLLSLTTKGIKKKGFDELSGKVPESFETYQFVCPNDIVMCLFDLDCSAVFSGRSPFYGMISPAYKVLNCKSIVNPQFADYWFSFVFDGRKFKPYSKNLRYTLNYDEFAVLPIVFPSLPEQEKIANFLDQKCAEIDAVIADTQKTIEEYKTLKQSIITEAVTKGVRGPRPMKDSGIEWIGDIPAEWEIVSLKLLCKMNAGKNISSNDISDNGKYPVFGGNGSRGYYQDYNVSGDFLLVGRQGALCGNVHHVVGEVWATEHAVITLPTEHSNIQFLFYLLVGMNLNQYVNNTAAQPGLAVSTIQSVKTCLVPIEEQKNIASYLDIKCSEIDRLIEAKQQLLTEMETLKKSVIYEYITGKKEVG